MATREQSRQLLLMSIQVIATALLIVLVVSGCTGSIGSQAHVSASPTTTPRLASASASPAPPETSSPTSVPIGPLGAPGCKPPSPMQPTMVAGPEIEGTSANASLWALLFQPLTTGQDIKIAWRMTGSGSLHLVAIGPQEQHIQPDWGPEAHLGSNWNRPGNEWGAGFTFTAAGCWDLHATRDDASGDIWLVIP